MYFSDRAHDCVSCMLGLESPNKPKSKRPRMSTIGPEGAKSDHTESPITDPSLSESRFLDVGELERVKFEIALHEASFATGDVRTRAQRVRAAQEKLRLSELLLSIAKGGLAAAIHTESHHEQLIPDFYYDFFHTVDQKRPNTQLDLARKWQTVLDRIGNRLYPGDLIEPPQMTCKRLNYC